jgi:hypothetical protein
LAADALTISGEPRTWAWWNPDKTVPHRRPGKAYPDGGMHLTADGSARWIKIEKTRYLSTWSPGVRDCFIYQEDLPPAMQPFMNALGLKPPL